MINVPHNFDEIETLGFERWEARQVDRYLDTQPERITVDRYNEKLEVLPPCRWENYGGISAFHVSERMTSDIVSWYAKSGDKCVEFYALSTISAATISDKFNEV